MSNTEHRSPVALITPILDRVNNCAETFRRAISTIAECNSSEKNQQSSIPTLIDELNGQYERFQLWCSNVGAYKRGLDSLDNQLTENFKLQFRVQKYLEDIQRGLRDTIDIVSGKVTPWDEFSDSSEDDDSSQTGKEEETELKQLVNFVKNSISCLLRISAIILNPGPHDRFTSADTVDQYFHQKWDERHVSEKFMNIPEWMVIRLGKANTWRRQFLESRKSYGGKIKNPRSFFDDGTTAVQSLPPEIRPSDQLLCPGDPEPRVANDMDDGNTVTSYAETVTNDNLLLVPTMPDQAKGGSLFECSLCFRIIGGIHNRMQWKRHVFTDLQPYICLFPGCSSADKTFARRHTWIRHENRIHRTGWRCSIGCDIDFLSKKEIHSHFADFHDLTELLEFQVDALSIQTQLVTPMALPCPLCHEKNKGLRSYYKHVSRHLEQLALFVVPNDILNRSCEVEEEEEEEDEKGGSIDEDIFNRSDNHEGDSQDEIFDEDFFRDDRENNGKPPLIVYPKDDTTSREEKKSEKDENKGDTSQEEDRKEDNREDKNSEEEWAQLQKREDLPGKKQDQPEQKTAHLVKESSLTMNYNSTTAPSSSGSSSFISTQWIWSLEHLDYYYPILRPDGTVERYKWAREALLPPQSQSSYSSSHPRNQNPSTPPDRKSFI